MTDVQLAATTASDRADVLGIHVSVTNLDDTVETFARWIDNGERQLVCVSDMNALLHARADEWLTEVYNTSGLTVPDGMPLVWAGRKAGFDRMARVAGEDLRETFQDRHAALKVVGVHCPPYRELTEAEAAAVVAELNAAKPDIIWIGLGAPKQERWMAEHRDRLDAAILIGVGAAFDFHTGRLDRAPLWMQRSGLEWSYRLYKEP